MKIISLNCWGGRLSPDLLEFVRTRSATTDVFCFQEVFRETDATGPLPPFHPTGDHALFERLVAVLSDFEGRFSASYGSRYGLATFVRKKIGIVSDTTAFVFRDGPDEPLESGLEGEHARSVFVVRLGNGIRVANFHGLWRKGTGKDDLPERIEQSNRMMGAFDREEGPIAVLGDFNLNPNTESIAVFERAGFRNLIKEKGVRSTRTHHFDPRWSPYADYALVRGVAVRDFAVLPDAVSDHAPLLLEIEA
ncbi:MAG: hypothetical protein QG650_35 [Patescibacteria group bacterium]|nr:hypothetical protein [Patescibacteria group bacterium]